MFSLSARTRREKVILVTMPTASVAGGSRGRLLDYRKKAARLRSIHSIKLTRYQALANFTTASLVALASTVTFFGFAGIDRLLEYVRWIDDGISKDQTEFGFNVLLLCVVILVILDLVYQFKERATRHNHAIVLLANFVNELDDGLANATTVEEEKRLLQTMATRYEVMTEFLPFNTDAEYQRSKRRDSDQKPGASKKLLAGKDGWSDDAIGHHRLESIILADDWRVDVLRVVRDLVPGAVIAGGFVRNPVWDALSDFQIPTQLDDVDVLLYDPDVPPQSDAELENRLRAAAPSVNWQVSNQAYAHAGQPHAGAESLEQSLKQAPETASSVAISLDGDERLAVLSPNGTDDLFRMIVRCRAHATNVEVERFMKRLRKKAWSQTWPTLVTVPPTATAPTPEADSVLTDGQRSVPARPQMERH